MKQTTMRKTVLITLLLLLAGGLHAQNHQYIADSAEIVVNRYLRLLNYDALRQDSMLYIETVIYSRSNPHDTIMMRRWHVAPYKYRTEIWHGDTLTTGLVCDAESVFLEYDRWSKHWDDVGVTWYYDHAKAYDFHEPLFNWKSEGCKLTYKGVWKFQGENVYRILVESPLRYDRYYLFEKNSGLLFLIDETTGHSPSFDTVNNVHVDWRAYHEYQPLGTAVFPSIESYQYDDDITFMFHKMCYLPINEELFKRGKR